MAYSTKKIFELQREWQEYMQDSWQRGHDNLEFVVKSEQYAKQPKYNEAEQFVFNMSHKILTTAQANGKDIELSLNLYKKGNEDDKEKEAFKCLLHQIMMSGENRQQIGWSLDKVYSFGQSVYHIKNVRENNQTLNQKLKLECVRDPTTVFFDKYAESPTFYDGNFAGRSYCIKGEALKRDYKKFSHLENKRKYEVIDFWFMQLKKVPYVCLITGEYKRIDLVDENTDVIDKSKPIKKGMDKYLCHKRVLKDEEMPLEKHIFPKVNVLPLVMDYGGFVWTGKHRLESFPLGWHLRDAQTLLNYSGSIIGDILKTMKDDRFFFNPEHLKSQEARNSANEVNTRSGGLIFTGNLATIRREVSQQLPEGLLSYFNELPNLIQNLAGSYIDGSNDQIKAMSGVALDKMFKRVDLVQNPFIVAHLKTLNVVGYVIQQMIPSIYHENRTLYLKQENGDMQEIEINKPQYQPNGYTTLINPIKNIANQYEYVIKASAAQRLQKQNLQTELQALYSLYQPAIATTIDLYVNTLDVPQTDVLSRRLGVTIPRELIQYGNNEINYAQYEQITEQKQAKAAQQQAQAEANNPQTQYLHARAQSEISRAQADQSNATTAAYRAQTEHLKVQEEAKNAHVKNVSDAVKVQFDQENAEAERQLQLTKSHLQQADDIIESLKPLRDE